MTASPAIAASVLQVSSRLEIREVPLSGLTGAPEPGDGFRTLTPEWYAWLRLRMEKARAAHQAGTLATEVWESLRERFNAIHDRAVAQFGMSELAEAIRTAAKPKPPAVAAPSPAIASPSANAPAVPPHPPAAALFRFPPTGEFRFTERVSPEAVAQVDAIRDQALALGWTLPQLYQNRGHFRFPCGPDWGLVTFLDDGRRLGEVTREFIEIIHPGPRESRGRFHNMEVDQPWLKRTKPKPAP